MNFLKKQTVSTWVTLGALILAIVSVAIFGANYGSTAFAGLFGASSSAAIISESVISIILLAAIICLSEFDFGGIIGWIVEWVIWACKIVVCALLALAVIKYLDMTVQGYANLWFSDENIQVTMQATEGYVSAANTAIVGTVMYAVTMLVAVVAAFFRPYKKAKKTEDNTDTADGAVETAA